MCEDLPVITCSAFGINGHDDALRPKTLSGLFHKLRPPDCRRIDAHFIGSGIQQGSDIVERPHTAANRHRHEDYGLFDISDNGRRTLGHDGDTLGYKSLMLLLPEDRLGVFVSYNGEEGARTASGD